MSMVEFRARRQLGIRSRIARKRRGVLGVGCATEMRGLQAACKAYLRQCSKYAASWRAISSTTLDQSQEGASSDLE
jgi:predicted naringenin-chalcone synthase